MSAAIIPDVCFAVEYLLYCPVLRLPESLSSASVHRESPIFIEDSHTEESSRRLRRASHADKVHQRREEEHGT